jgi:hypothetical protein
MPMGLEEWVANRWVVPHVATRAEMTEFLAAVEVDLETATAAMAPAWCFAIAYTAALRLCSLALNAAGYRASGERRHYRTITALPLVMAGAAQDTAAYLEQCSRKRHEVTYESVGGISADEADELVSAVRELRTEIVGWLERSHPALVS